jgi:hypothetical protein
MNNLPRLASNSDPPDRCLPCSLYYRREPLVPGHQRNLLKDTQEINTMWLLIKDEDGKQEDVR